MADSVRLLGYSRPSGHTKIYECSSRTDSGSELSGFRPVISSVTRSIIVCNTHADKTTFTIRFIPNSQEDSAISPSDSYNIFDSVPIAGKATTVISPGILMRQGKTADLSDYITVYSANNSVNFFIFGVETT